MGNPAYTPSRWYEFQQRCAGWDNSIENLEKKCERLEKEIVELRRDKNVLEYRITKKDNIMKIKYVCEYTKQEFDTEKEVLESEKKNKQIIFRTIFPRNHDSDDNYNIHCVKCGTLLLQYESVYDGHRNERGDITENKWRAKIFESWFCDPCHEQTLNILTDIVINNQDKFQYIPIGTKYK